MEYPAFQNSLAKMKPGESAIYVTPDGNFLIKRIDKKNRADVGKTVTMVIIDEYVSKEVVETIKNSINPLK